MVAVNIFPDPFFFLQMFESSATYPGAYDTQLSTMQPDLIASHRNSHHASHLQFKNHVTQVAQDASESSEIMHRFFKDVPLYKKDANLLLRHLSTKNKIQSILVKILECTNGSCDKSLPCP